MLLTMVNGFNFGNFDICFAQKVVTAGSGQKVDNGDLGSSIQATLTVSQIVLVAFATKKVWLHSLGKRQRMNP
jgi:hypothetical protein